MRLPLEFLPLASGQQQSVVMLSDKNYGAARSFGCHSGYAIPPRLNCGNPT
jgi:hypothetical protein